MIIIQSNITLYSETTLWRLDFRFAADIARGICHTNQLKID